MADYYPLIARAVAGLERNTGDARRALYERARTALVAQLRGVTPALGETDVTRERLALEEAIRKVEAESARQSWVEPQRVPKMRPPQMPRWEEPEVRAQPEQQEHEEAPVRRPSPPRPEAATRRQAAAPAARQATAPVARQAAAQSPDAMLGEQRYADPLFDQPLPEHAAPAPQRHPLRGRPAGDRRSLLDSGLKDFREVVHDENDVDDAPPRTSRPARDGYAPAQARAYDYERDGRMPQRDDYDPPVQDTPAPMMLEPSFALDESRPLPPRGRSQTAPVEGEAPVPGRSYGDLIRVGIALAMVACLAGLAIWMWPTMASFYRQLRAPPTEAAKDAPAPATRPKIIERFEPGAQPGQQQQQQAALPSPQSPGVAQRVVLYEEDPADSAGKQYVGSAVWRTEMVSPGPGQSPELAIRADIEIPDRKLAITWSLRRDTMPATSISHTMEIMFKLPADFPGGGISGVPGILMKESEQTRGVPLAGYAMKVTNSFFLIALSAAETDKQRNVQLLRDRNWFDIPVVYNNNRRAIIAIEKGTPGERVFAEAFAKWGQ